MHLSIRSRFFNRLDKHEQMLKTLTDQGEIDQLNRHFGREEQASFRLGTPTDQTVSGKTVQR